MFFKNTLIRIIIVFLSAAGYAYADMPESSMLDSEEIYHIITSGETEYNIYDIRNDVDYLVLHIAGSLHIPMRDFEKRIAEIPRDKLAILVSRNPAEAGAARRILLDRGYSRDLIKIFSENIDIWAGKGYPLESDIVFGC